jgi:Tol biopolymer transport system component
MIFETRSRNYVVSILVVLALCVRYSMSFGQGVQDFAHPVWSPDGEYVAFAAYSNDGFEILKLKIVDRTLTSLTHEIQKGSVASMVWSPDGNFIAYTVVLDNLDIWIVPIDEGQHYNLTMNTDSSSDNPAWSSDSRRIAFTVTKGFGSSLNSEIWTADVVTREVSQVTSDDNCYTEPEWVQDDNVIVFVAWSCSADEDGLYLYDFSRSEVVPMSYGRAINYAFSPSEDYIAVSVLKPDSDFLTDLILLGDRIRVNLTEDTALRFIRELSWSPDEQQLVFSTLCFQGATITTINVTNYQISDIANCTNEEFFNFSPAWSPDGLSIVYQSDKAGRDDIWLYILDTEEHINLTEGL